MSGKEDEDEKKQVDLVCPVCGAELRQQQCKVFCSRCHTLVFNCSEF